MSCTSLGETKIMVRPLATEQEIVSKIAHLYGLDVVKIKRLDGYDDLNFYIETKPSDDSSSMKFVCKVLNSNDSNDTDLIDSQHRLLMHLDGQVTRHVFRLLIFLEGSKLDASPPSAKLYQNVGKLAGKLFAELKDYDDAVLRSRKYLWMLESVPQLRSYCFAVEDSGRRDLASAVIQAFEQRVMPVLPELGVCAIHGDLNEHNVLVEGSDVVGLIDFGDICYAPPLFDIAICMAYMIIHSKDISAGKDVLAGYRTYRKLSRIEIDLMKVCVCARLAQSLVLGCYSAREAPNNQYILSSQKNGWPLLEKMWALTEHQIQISWGLVESD